jgi:hypothetical protein
VVRPRKGVVVSVSHPELAEVMIGVEIGPPHPLTTGGGAEEGMGWKGPGPAPEGVHQADHLGPVRLELLWRRTSPSGFGLGHGSDVPRVEVGRRARLSSDSTSKNSTPSPSLRVNTRIRPSAVTSTL